MPKKVQQKTNPDQLNSNGIKIDTVFRNGRKFEIFAVLEDSRGNALPMPSKIAKQVQTKIAVDFRILCEAHLKKGKLPALNFKDMTADGVLLKSEKARRTHEFVLDQLEPGRLDRIAGEARIEASKMTGKDIWNHMQGLLMSALDGAPQKADEEEPEIRDASQPPVAPAKKTSRRAPPAPPAPAPSQVGRPEEEEEAPHEAPAQGIDSERPPAADPAASAKKEALEQPVRNEVPYTQLMVKDKNLSQLDLTKDDWGLGLSRRTQCAVFENLAIDRKGALERAVQAKLSPPSGTTLAQMILDQRDQYRSQIAPLNLEGDKREIAENMIRAYYQWDIFPRAVEHIYTILNNKDRFIEDQNLLRLLTEQAVAEGVNIGAQDPAEWAKHHYHEFGPHAFMEAFLRNLDN